MNAEARNATGRDGAGDKVRAERGRAKQSNGRSGTERGMDGAGDMVEQEGAGQSRAMDGVG